MLTKLTIENLKCFGEKTTIPLAPMTLIYGENSSGKSTVLLAVQLLRRQLLEDSPFRHADFPYMGYVTGHDTRHDITIGIEAHGLPPKDEGFAFSRFGEYPAKTVLTWSYEKQKLELKTLDILQINNDDEDRPVRQKWEFKRDGADMVASASPYLAGRMIHIMSDNRSAILEGVERQIEADIMREYLANNPEEYRRLLENVGYSRKHYEKMTILSLARAETREAHEKLTALREVEVAAEANERANGQAWRLDLPDWIKNCPPSWRTYRESHEFKAKAENLRATTYRDIVDFCATGYPTYFEAAQARLRLRDGLLNQREEYERSVVFTRDTLGLCDLQLHISTSSNDQEKLDVELWQIDKCDGKYEDVFQQDERLEREEPSNFKEVASIVVESMRQIVVIAPLRKPAKRKYPSVSTPHDDEESDVGSSKVPLMLKGDDNLRARVNEWLIRLGVDYAVEIQTIDEEDFKILLRDTRIPDAPLVNYADVGFGISQILPILVACLSSRPSTILIEQPELHIHPRLQAELGSLFAEAIHTYHHQLIVETHSEHLMLRVQRLIRTKKPPSVSNGDVCVLYVCRGESGSNVQPLRLTESGRFKDLWPDGFFPERENELEGE